MADPGPPISPQVPCSPVGPQVNDQYWFSYSKTLIDGALKSRDDAAATLQAFVGWLWTAYTAGAVVGVNLGKLSFALIPSLLIGSPVVALVGVYWLTVWVRTPEVIAFDPRLPKDIEHAYDHNLKVKQHRLAITLVCTALAGALTASAIVYASIAYQSAVSLQLSVRAQLDHQTRTIFVSGAVPDLPKVQLGVYEFDSNTGLRGKCLTSEEIASDRGIFRSMAIPISGSAAKALRVEITGDLKESGGKVLLSKEITF